MNLTEDQRKKVAEWVDAGVKLSDIQTRLFKELGVKLTYMEVRLLVDDLKLVLKDPEPPKAAGPAADAAKLPDLTPPPEEPQPRASGVNVTVDQIAKPGAVVSGKVGFSDGQTAEWYLDQMGRLGFAPKTPGYKPSAPDLQQFQTALQNELARLGY